MGPPIGFPFAASNRPDFYRVSQTKVDKFEIRNLCSENRSIIKIGVITLLDKSST